MRTIVENEEMKFHICRVRKTPPKQQPWKIIKL